eukprot:TRINITY_DN11688_c0_g2_i1.p1 TRINITY_DN11688_c0_g2~~TRINITY_DN11688_c0_g2_i1.p1  ORF type:complete len:138 (-),score=20.86 TRINITY_DN11688_c0_g2_i1:220-633(-)
MSRSFKVLAIALAFRCLSVFAEEDCTQNDEQAKCCPLQSGQPCLFQNFNKPTSPCSVACQKKFQILGYDCFKDFNMNFMWGHMKSNCDPQNLVEFKAPTTSYKPAYGAAPASSLAASSRAASFLAFLGISVLTLAAL